VACLMVPHPPPVLYVYSDNLSDMPSWIRSRSNGPSWHF
jgi:hypothetical protein